MTTPYPDHPQLRGNYAPIRMECDLDDVIVRGDLPADLDITYYRNGPDPQFPPTADHHWFAGDGMLHNVPRRERARALPQPVGSYREVADRAARGSQSHQSVQPDPKRPDRSTSGERRARQHQHRLARRQASRAGRRPCTVRDRPGDPRLHRRVAIRRSARRSDDGAPQGRSGDRRNAVLRLHGRRDVQPGCQLPERGLDRKAHPCRTIRGPRSPA